MAEGGIHCLVENGHCAAAFRVSASARFGKPPLFSSCLACAPYALPDYLLFFGQSVRAIIARKQDILFTGAPRGPNKWRISCAILKSSGGTRANGPNKWYPHSSMSAGRNQVGGVHVHFFNKEQQQRPPERYPQVSFVLPLSGNGGRIAPGTLPSSASSSGNAKTCIGTPNPLHRAQRSPEGPLAICPPISAAPAIYGYRSPCLHPSTAIPSAEQGMGRVNAPPNWSLCNIAPPPGRSSRRAPLYHRRRGQ